MTEKISTSRNALMGFAILWVMAYHSGISFSILPVVGGVVNQFRAVGYGGVDIFMLLSGFGLYQSLSKNPDPLTFYARRIKRILPAYLPVLAVWLWLNLPGNPCAYWPRIVLGNLTGSVFWTKGSPAFNWYMLALPAFYFTAPVLFQLVERPGGGAWAMVSTVLMDICFYGDYTLIAVVRFTPFVMGMVLGRWAALDRDVPASIERTAYILGLAGYGALMYFLKTMTGDFLWYGGYYWYPFAMIAPALTFLLARMFCWMKACVPFLFRFFDIVGTCSLEIYLIHIVVFEYIHVLQNRIWPLVYVVMIVSGYIYHVMTGKIVKALPARRVKIG